MVFCVIFVFSTLLEFAILIFVQKQIFDRKVKKAVDALCKEKLLSISVSRCSGKRGSNKSFHRNVDAERSPTSSAKSLKLVTIPWDDTIENGMVGSITNTEKDDTLSNKASEQKHKASQTSSNFGSTLTIL